MFVISKLGKYIMVNALVIDNITSNVSRCASVTLIDCSWVVWSWQILTFSPLEPSDICWMLMFIHMLLSVTSQYWRVLIENYLLNNQFLDELSPDQQVQQQVITFKSTKRTLKFCTEDLLKHFWEIEEIPSVAYYSLEEKHGVSHFKESMYGEKSGRCIVSLPLKRMANWVKADGRLWSILNKLKNVYHIIKLSKRVILQVWKKMLI